MDIKVLFMFLMLKMSSSYKYTNINKNKFFLKPFINKKKLQSSLSELYFMGRWRNRMGSRRITMD